MKKVLFVATVTTHINFFHIPYLKIFKEKEYEVHVASFGEEPIEYCDKHFNIPFARSPLKLQNYKAYKELKKIINDNDYEIIHCHTPVGGLLARLAARKARKKGTRVIYTAHGFHFYKGAPVLNWMIYYPIEKYLAKYTDCLITINEEDYEIAKKKFKAKKIEFVHGVGVDENKFNFKMSEDKKLEIRNNLELAKSDIVISYVAELNKNKNQIMIINAIKELFTTNQNIKVLLIGMGNYIKYLEKNIAKNKLEKNVILLGYRKDVSQLLRITDLYISTSKREGLPVNIMEAMLAELPIIATNTRGNRNLVQNSKNGFLVEIDNAKQLAIKIKELISDKELMKKFGDNARKKVEPYELKNVIKEMEKIYNNEE